MNSARLANVYFGNELVSDATDALIEELSDLADDMDNIPATPFPTGQMSYPPSFPNGKMSHPPSDNMSYPVSNTPG
jgi:hypothetical protein